MKHDFRTECLIDLLDALLCEKMFDQLRNKEQFGYFVSCSSRNTQGVLGF